jgi:hypothetical protein
LDYEGGGSEMKKVILPILGLIVSIVGVYLGWIQYQSSKEAERAAQPNVVVCLRALSYERSNTRGTGDDTFSVPKGQVSLRLVNNGATAVTVTKVMLNPVGTWRDGRHGGLGSIDVEVDVPVPARGVTPVDNMQFTADFSVQEKFWIDTPESVNVQAYWPGGTGPMLQCIPRATGWSCGHSDAAGLAIQVDAACQ